MRHVVRLAGPGILAVALLSSCYLSWGRDPRPPACPDDEQDRDGDGWGECSDCDDTDPFVNPGFTVDGGCCGIFDGKDNDCDGAIDEDENNCDVECFDEHDRDGDGYSSPEDCDDLDPRVHPNQFDGSDPCFGAGNGIDDDCDGQIDEDFIGEPQYGCPEDLDDDGDGWFRGEDCDDADPNRNPGRNEYCCPCPGGDFPYPDCNGVDDDCDGEVDEANERDMAEDEFCCSF